MGTLREVAQAYEPQQTFNIADLEAVPIDLELVLRTGEKTSDAGVKEIFDYNVIILNNKEYRVAKSVIEQIQTIIKLKPSVEYVKVHKTGSGMATRYKVDVIDSTEDISVPAS